MQLALAFCDGNAIHCSPKEPSANDTDDDDDDGGDDGGGGGERRR